ncbi:MAG: GNAT family N-acetyltransferase [Psychroflexus halocasei]
MTIKIKDFNHLSSAQLYAILALRSEVFVVEQNCPYQDIDNLDQEAQHVCFYKKGELVAYARILPAGTTFDSISIGRFLVKKTHRQKHLGHDLIQTCLTFIKENYSSSLIKISAQQYLIDFYAQHGFQTVGEGYLEDDIPHIEMHYEREE